MTEIDQRPADDSQNPPAPDKPALNHAPIFAAAAQPSYTRTLFVGPDGLRPGWGLAFYFLTFYCLQRLLDFWSESWKLGELRAMMGAEFGSFLAALIPALILARVERRPWKIYGLPLRRAFGKLFWVGAVWGFAGITVLVGSQYELRAFVFGHIVLHGMRMAKFGAFWMLMFLLVAFFEEFLLRGYSQFTLTRGLGFWPAAVALSSLFGLIHLWNGGEEWPGLLAAAAIGFFLCLTLRRTGSLWFAVGFHAAWDWGETFFYSVPDSGTVFPGHLLSSSFRGPAWITGGSVGPEGSVLCFVVIAALWVGFDRVYREAKYFPAGKQS